MTRKCNYCEDLFCEKEMVNFLRNSSSPEFVPDEHFKSEDEGWICKKCEAEEEEFYLNGNKN